MPITATDPITTIWVVICHCRKITLRDILTIQISSKITTCRMGRSKSSSQPICTTITILPLPVALVHPKEEISPATIETEWLITIIALVATMFTNHLATTTIYQAGITTTSHLGISSSSNSTNRTPSNISLTMTHLEVVSCLRIANTTITTAARVEDISRIITVYQISRK